MFDIFADEFTRVAFFFGGLARPSRAPVPHPIADSQASNTMRGVNARARRRWELCQLDGETFESGRFICAIWACIARPAGVPHCRDIQRWIAAAP